MMARDSMVKGFAHDWHHSENMKGRSAIWQWASASNSPPGTRKMLRSP